MNAQPGYVVGNWIDFNRAFNGDIAEIIVYDRALSDGSDNPSNNELGAILFYLQEKYGLDLDIDIESENQTEITSDIGDQMQGQNGSAFIRFPFEVNASNEFDRLILQMQYDDGFVAHLNGQEVARRNAPAAATWNSTATGARPNQQAVVFEDIDITANLGSLQQGNNVLAIHGLNRTPNDGDFLVLPKLVGVDVVDADLNFGSAPTLQVDGDAANGSDRSAMLHWDISDVPAGATILGASITVNVTDPTGGPYELYQVLKAWEEGGSSWQGPTNGANWEQAGAQGIADRGATALASVSINAKGRQTFNLNADGVELVQAWVDGRTINNGFILANADTTDSLTFDSREAADSANRPTLNISFIQTGAKPGDFDNDGGLDNDDVNALSTAIINASTD